MMISARLLVSMLLLVFTGDPLYAQNPIGYADLIDGLSNEFFKSSDLVEAVHRGIAFDVRTKQLTEILDAAAAGKRNSSEVAAIIVACLEACEKCRARGLAPLTMTDLKTLFKWNFSPNAIWDEARIRSVKDLEITKASADELREIGAQDDLLALLLPDDRMSTAPPQGDYKKLSLRHSETYNVNAPEGLLRISADIPANSQSEFVFKHNALFARAVKGEEPNVDLDDSAFNRPAPRNTEKAFVEWDDPFLNNFDQKGGFLRGAAKVKTTVEYLEGDADGRNAFRIQITNLDKKPQRCSLTLSWKVRTTPKPPASGTKRQ